MHGGAGRGGGERKRARKRSLHAVRRCTHAKCCVPVGAFDIPARVPRGKSLSTTVIDDRRVERTALIYRPGGKKYFSGARRREAEIGRRRTAGDTPRRKFTIIFAGAGRAAKWNFHDMAYTSRDETFFPDREFHGSHDKRDRDIGKQKVESRSKFSFYLPVAGEV